MTDFNPDDPTGEIQVVTNLVMSRLERRGKQGDYEAIKAKVTAWLRELDDCGQLSRGPEFDGDHQKAQ